MLIEYKSKNVKNCLFKKIKNYFSEYEGGGATPYLPKAGIGVSDADGRIQNWFGRILIKYMCKMFNIVIFLKIKKILNLGVILSFNAFESF